MTKKMGGVSKNHKILKILCFSLVFSTLSATPLLISSCSKKKNPTEYIGSWDGSDWKGYKSGTLECVPNEGGKSVTIDNARDYEATNLIIPCKVTNGGQTYSVTKISQRAFADSGKLTGSITFADSIREIGKAAFYSCRLLTGNLTIPDSMESIGDNAFSNCDRLIGLILGKSLQSIGKGVFSSCDGLIGNLTIPDSVESIGEMAFSSCEGLTGNLTIPDSVESIGNAAFAGCNKIDTLIIDNWTNIPSGGNNAFTQWNPVGGNIIFNNVNDPTLRANILKVLYENGNLPNTWVSAD